MSDLPMFEVTISFKYKADPSDYKLSGPVENMFEEMAQIDAASFDEDPDLLYELMESEVGSWDINVKPVTEED